MQSPLRYPGGKGRFVDVVKEILQESQHAGLPLFEPYAGSASVSLGLLQGGVVPHVTLNERDPLLYSFWKCVFTKTEDLVEAFLKLPITIGTWKSLRPLLGVTNPTNKDLVKLGTAALFFNRANFSGILHGGPIGGHEQQSDYPIACRTNKSETIARIAEIAELRNYVNVQFGDGLKLIVDHSRKQKVFFYVDPPYYTKGKKLYRHHFKLSDHKNLARALTASKFPWLLSYDRHEIIEFLYEDFDVRHYGFRYSARSSKRDDELVIANFELPENL